jgi:hypothetical protein
MNRMIMTTVAVIVAQMLFSGVTRAEETLTIVGTLTCLTSEAPADPRSDASLSCNFKPISGLDSNYDGHIARVGPPDLPSGKRVLVGSVLAAKPVDVGALTGTYHGETGGRPAGILNGDNAVRLEPVTHASQIGDEPIPTILELRLETTKV